MKTNTIVRFSYLLIFCVVLGFGKGVQAALSSEVGYVYNPNGTLASMTDSTGTTNYEYDALNRLIKITNPSGEVTGYTYDALGRKTGTSLANGVTTDYSYDTAGRLESLTHGGTINPVTFSYSHDKVGNRTGMTDGDGAHSYVYDQLQRLEEATHPQPVNPAEQFDYDPAGNRLGNTYNAANQLLEDDKFTYSYDKNGNTTEKTDKSSGEVTRYNWNAENQLINLDKYHSASDAEPYLVASYIYDGFSRRVVKNIGGKATRYIYDREDILFETDVNNNILARYTHGPGIDEPISMQRDGQSYYYLADGLGNIIKLGDSNGTVINEYLYHSFGKIAEKTENVPNPYTYTAREYDTESGLHFYRNRYYDPQSGRFISEDPIGLLGAMNLYTYVDNNPINLIDPFGLCPAPKDLGLLKAILAAKEIPLTEETIAHLLDLKVEAKQLLASLIRNFNVRQHFPAISFFNHWTSTGYIHPMISRAREIIYNPNFGAMIVLRHPAFRVIPELRRWLFSDKELPKNDPFNPGGT